MAPTDFIWNHVRGGQQSLRWSETTRLSVGLRGLSWSETPRLSVGLRPGAAACRGRRPKNRSQQRRKGGEKSGSPASGKLSWLPWWLPFCCLRPWSSVCVSGSWSCGCFVLPGVGCWVAVSGALASSLVVGCCPCLPGSGFCAGFREKGRRPKNRSRRSFARAGLFQVHPGIMAVLWRSTVTIALFALLGGIVVFYSPPLISRHRCVSPCTFYVTMKRTWVASLAIVQQRLQLVQTP